MFVIKKNENEKNIKTKEPAVFFPRDIAKYRKIKNPRKSYMFKKKLFSLIFTVSARKKMKEGEIKINWDIKNSFLIWNI